VSDIERKKAQEAVAADETRTTVAPVRPPALRSLRRPALWLAAWIAMIAAVVVGSLLPAGELPPVPFNGFDKIQHLLGYFVLSAFAVMLFARMRTQVLCAAGLVALGIGLEVAQAALTASREADPADALFNAVGVLAGLAIAATPLANLLQRLDARWR
jgi:VanZ family protein